MSRLSIPAHSLQIGDRISSGETVTYVGTGTRTPRGKIEIGLENAGGLHGTRRLVTWNRNTVISVERGKS